MLPLHKSFFSLVFKTAKIEKKRLMRKNFTTKTFLCKLPNLCSVARVA